VPLKAFLEHQFREMLQLHNPKSQHFCHAAFAWVIWGMCGKLVWFCAGLAKLPILAAVCVWDA
jgi:hypothetical protein